MSGSNINLSFFLSFQLLSTEVITGESGPAQNFMYTKTFSAVLQVS